MKYKTGDKVKFIFLGNEKIGIVKESQPGKKFKIRDLSGNNLLYSGIYYQTPPPKKRGDDDYYGWICGKVK
jgi:hypothetical protein